MPLSIVRESEVIFGNNRGLRGTDPKIKTDQYTFGREEVIAEEFRFSEERKTVVREKKPKDGQIVWKPRRGGKRRFSKIF